MAGLLQALAVPSAFGMLFCNALPLVGRFRHDPFMGQDDADRLWTNKRVYCGIELNPAYVDVVVKR